MPKSVPKDTRSVHGEYPAERLLPLLIDLNRVDAGMDLDSFRTLRLHLNAAYNNDGSALGAAFHLTIPSVLITASQRSTISRLHQKITATRAASLRQFSVQARKGARPWRRSDAF